jgi:hypothetical protein
MADITANVDAWSSTEGSNSPSGSTTIGSGLDDNLRAAQAGVVLWVERFPHIHNLALESSVGSNALTITLSGKDSADPSSTNKVRVPFRNVTAATGDFAQVVVSAATTLTVSSGSTLGTFDGTAFRLWIVGFNDGGTFRLGVINCVQTATTLPNIYPLGGFGIASSTAEGGAGASDSAHVFYTGSGVTSKAYTVLGYMSWESGLTTAGTWDAGPTRIQLFHPGVPLPGATIRTVIDTHATEVTEAGATFVTTELAVTFTPNSAANVIKLETSFTGGGLTATSPGTIAEYQIARGTATGTSLATRRIEIVGDGSNSNWESNGAVHILAFDTNQSASTTYTVAMRDAGTGSVKAMSDNTTGILVASELMA